MPQILDVLEAVVARYHAEAGAPPPLHHCAQDDVCLLPLGSLSTAIAILPVALRRHPTYTHDNAVADSLSNTGIAGAGMPVVGIGVRRA